MYLQIDCFISCCRPSVIVTLGVLLVASNVCAQEPAQDEASPFPTVVLERNTSFSIADAATRPDASNKPVVPQPFLPKEIYQRTSNPILDATNLISEGFERSVVELHDGESVLGLATVVSLKGHVVTKRSLMQDIPLHQIRFRLAELEWSGTVVANDHANDLTVFTLDGEMSPAHFLRPVTFTGPKSNEEGKLVISPGSNGDTLSVGMTTRAPIMPRFTNPDGGNSVDLGLSMTADLKLTRVYPRTFGERLGLLVGDQILMMNQRRIQKSGQFLQLEKSIEPGDIVTIAYRRNGKAFVITDKVPDLTSLSKQDRWGGGPFSKRRSGFGDVLVHDSVIRPTDCGGPLVNLRGEFCGINIARSTRVASFTIPAASIRTFLNSHLDSSHLITGKLIDE